MHFDGANDLVRLPDGRDLAGVDPVIDGPLGLEAENAQVRGGAAIALALPRLDVARAAGTRCLSDLRVAPVRRAKCNPLLIGLSKVDSTSRVATVRRAPMH